MRLVNLSGLLLFLFLLAGTNCYANGDIEKIREAYMINDIGLLSQMSLTGNKETADVSLYYLSMVDFNNVAYGSLKNAVNRLNDVQSPAYKLLSTKKTEREIKVLNEVESMTAEDLSRYYQTNIDAREILEDYASKLSLGFGELDFLELKYLRNNIGFFDKSLLKKCSKEKFGEVEQGLRKNLKVFCDQEKLLTQIFLQAIRYEVMDGLKIQFEAFAKSYASRQNQEETSGKKIYEGFVEEFNKHWNSTIINEHLKKKMPQLVSAINDSRNKYLEELAIEKGSSFTSLNPSVSFKINHDFSGFNQIADKRSSLSTSSTTASVVSTVLGFFTGGLGGLALDAGASVYKSAKAKNEARDELTIHKNILRNTYAKAEKQTKAVLDKMASDILSAQKQNSGLFFNYVLENY